MRLDHAVGPASLPLAPGRRANSAASAQADKRRGQRRQRPRSDRAATTGGWWARPTPCTITRTTTGDHEPVYMIGLERQRSDGWVWGGTYFSNSFGQPSGYVYVRRNGHPVQPLGQALLRSGRPA